MRELIAFAIMYFSFGLVDLKDGGFFSSIMFMLSITAMIYLSAALAERFFSPNMRKWYRITPGEKTKLNEAEWEKMDKKKSPATDGISSPEHSTTDTVDFYNQEQSQTTMAEDVMLPTEMPDAETENQFDDIFSSDKDK